MPTIDKALQIAAKAHEGQKDKDGQPYILHPLRVMNSVEGDEAKVVAVLHDVIEDSAVTEDDLRREGFAESVIAAVLCVTHRKDESYADYVVRCKANEVARKVKLADLEDNSRPWPGHPPPGSAGTRRGPAPEILPGLQVPDRPDDRAAVSDGDGRVRLIDAEVLARLRLGGSLRVAAQPRQYFGPKAPSLFQRGRACCRRPARNDRLDRRNPSITASEYEPPCAGRIGNQPRRQSGVSQTDRRGPRGPGRSVFRGPGTTRADGRLPPRSTASRTRRAVRCAPGGLPRDRAACGRIHGESHDFAPKQYDE